jgi:polysaccharide deacetylase family protein (PEP-CTERM system associated)
LTPDQFREDTIRAKEIIEQAAGAQVLGYRAPSFSVIRKSLWALPILEELGFRYDSSIFPVRHDFYGIPDAPRSPFKAGELTEFPMTTFRMFGDSNLPVGGGGYLRLFPFWYTRTGVSRAWRDGIPLITYIHPWEIDPGQPRLPGRWRSRLRHYTNLQRMSDKLRNLCALADFQSFRDSGLLEQCLPGFFGNELKTQVISK